MTPPAVRRRRLRPGLLVPVGDHLWVLDEVQPVAVVLDVTTAVPITLVSWPDVPAGPDPGERRVFGAQDGLWTQQPGGPVVRLGLEGVRGGHHVSDDTLGAVSAHGAWCAPTPRAQDIAATQDAPPFHYRTSDRLRLARPGQVTRTVEVEAPVRSIQSVGDDLFVEIEDGEWSRRSLGTPTQWELVGASSWLRLGAEQAIPSRLDLAEHGHDAPPTVESRFGWRGTFRIPHLGPRSDHGQRPVPRERTDGLDWYVGWDRDSTTRPHQVYAVAVREGTSAERWRVRLGPGLAVATAVTDRHLWVALQDPRNTATYSAPTPTRVLRVNVSTGEVEEILGADTVDVTRHCWPLGAPPVDADDYAAFWRRQLSGLDAIWTDEDGMVSPLAEGLSDASVEIVGSWPATTLHVTFAWTRRPGVRLRRVIALYDDLGRSEEPLYADIHLMEDLDTGNVATGPLPGSDHLDL